MRSVIIEEREPQPPQQQENETKNIQVVETPLQHENSVTAATKESEKVHNNEPLLTIDQFLSYTNKKIVRSEADGSCLFRSVSNGLVHSQNKHHQVRKLAVEWMKTNLDTLIDDVPFRETIFLKENQMSVEEYLRDMSREGEWGDFSCIVALSQVLRVRFKVVVVRDEFVTSVLDVSPEQQQLEDKEENGGVIWLMFDEPRRHYNLIVSQ